MNAHACIYRVKQIGLEQRKRQFIHMCTCVGAFRMGRVLLPHPAWVRGTCIQHRPVKVLVLVMLVWVYLDDARRRDAAIIIDHVILSARVSVYVCMFMFMCVYVYVMCMCDPHVSFLCGYEFVYVYLSYVSMHSYSSCETTHIRKMVYMQACTHTHTHIHACTHKHSSARAVSRISEDIALA